MTNLDVTINQDILSQMSGVSGDVIATSPTNRRGKEIMYWKRCMGCNIHDTDFGYVILGPTMNPLTAIEYTEFMNGKHATPLPQYGTYGLGSVNGQKYNLMEPGQRFKAIIENNGIHEFPVEQAIELNWHKFPVLHKVFPQLADIVDIHCEYGCGANRVYKTQEHYNIHVRVWHNDVAQSRAIGKEFSTAIESINKAQQFDPALIAQIVLAVSMAMKGEIPDESKN